MFSPAYFSHTMGNMFKIPWFQKSDPSIKSGSSTASTTEESGENVVSFQKNYLETNQADYKKYIKTLTHTVGVSKDDFHTLYSLPIQAFIQYCHGLPVSLDEHHCYKNGLIRHALNTALYCTRSADGAIFSARVHAEIREPSEIRWRYAAFLCGLYCDLKKLQGLVVSAGDKQWNPLLTGISQWAQENRIKTCRYTWKEESEGNINYLSAVYGAQLLTPESAGYLTVFNHDIIDILFQVLGGALKEHEHKLAELVAIARENSISKDFATHTSQGMEKTASPQNTQMLIVDAIRRLLKKEWQVNKPNSIAWYTEEGLFFVWERAAKDIIRLLTEDHIYSIPRDPDTLAELLLEGGLIERGVIKAMYWRLIPNGKNGNVLETIKISNIDAIFVSTKDRPIPIRLEDGEVQGRAKPGKANPSTAKENTVQENTSIPGAVSDNSSLQTQAVDKNPTDPPVQVDPWFQKHGKLGALLRTIKDELNSKVLEVGKDVLWTPDGLAIHYPAVIESYGLEPKDIVKQLNAKGWIEKDPQQPTAALRKIPVGDNPECRVIILNQKVGSRILAKV